MADKTPVRVVLDASDVATGLAEFQSGDTLALSHGGTGTALSIGLAGQVLRVNADRDALEFVDSGDIDIIASSDSTGVQVQDDLNVSGTLSVNVLDVNEISSVDSTAVTIKDDLMLAGTLRAEDSGTISIDGAIESSGAITTGGIVTATGFTIGSAVINEAELETIDGITAGTVTASKAVIVDSNKDIGTLRNITSNGTIQFGSLSDGTITVTAFVDEDNMSSDSATLIPTQQSVKAYVDTELSSFSSILNVVGDDSTDMEIALGTDRLFFQGGTNISTSTDSGAQLTISVADAPTFSGAVTAAGFTIGSAAINESELETIDGVTAGTVAASKAVVVDGSKNIGTFGSVTATTFVIGSADIDETDLEKIDGITNGTAAANKAVVVDGNKDIGTLRNITSNGTIQFGSLSDGTITATAFVDEDDMSSNSATLIPTQQSVKAYVDSEVGGVSGGSSTINIVGDDSTDMELTLGTDRLFIAGGTNVSTSTGSSSQITISVADAPTFSGAVTAAGFTIGSAAINETELETIDGITAGTVAASKAVVVDSNKDVTGFRNVTGTGDVEGASLTVSSGVAISASSGDVTVANATSNKDLIFTVNDGGSATEVFRLDGDVSAMLVASGKELRFADSGEKISGDGTDLTIASGAKINLTATSDVVVPANVGITFGDGEKIEGDDTNLTVTSGGAINLTATTDVVIPANVGITFGTGEKIEGDSTDLTVTSGGKINLTATSDIHIPNDVGIVFGDAAEKIEGDGTDLTITGNNIKLTAAADIVVPANVGITFGTGEKIEGDSTDLTVTSGAKINLNATSDIHIPNDVGIVFGGASEKIEGDGTDLVISANNLTVDAAADIILDAGGNDFQFKAGGTHILSVVNSSSDVVIKPIVDAKDIIFQQRDGTEVARIEDNATFNVVTGKLAINGTAITSTAAELNLVDGITAGTVSASKAVITDSNKDALGFRNISATGTAEIGGDLQVGGNFTVSGTTTSVNTTNLEVQDALLELNKNNSGGADVDAGMFIQRGSAGNNAVLYWNEGDDTFKAVLSNSAATADAITDSSFAGLEVGSLTVNAGVAITASSGDVTVANATSNKDLIFTVNDGGSATEVMRLDGDVSAILVASGKELRFADSGEKISGDGTDLTIASGAKINLTATSDVVVPANVGITFGTGEKIEGDNTDLTITSGGKINLATASDVHMANDKGIVFGDAGEKIEGDGTDLTISSSAKLNLTATSDVHIPKNVGLVFDDNASEKIESDDTDLTIASGAKINLNATSDVHIPNDVGIVFGGASEKIEGDGTDLVISANNLTVDAAADIILDAGGNDFQFKAGGTHVLSIVNSSSDVIIKPIVDAKDIIFQQRDGTEVARIEDNATFNVVTGKLAINGTAITSTAAELNALDGLTAVVGELNALDIGSTAVGTAVASKAVILDSNKDYTGFRNITATGTVKTAILDVNSIFSTDSSNIRISEGLDVVGGLFLSEINSIDSSAIEVNEVTNFNANVVVKADITATGALTSNTATVDGGVSIDNITIDGTEIDLSSGDLTIDVAGDIELNADGGDIKLQDASVTFGHLTNSSSDFVIEAKVQDKDIIFKGDDGGSGITALTLDMSDAGSAAFNDKVTIGDGKLVLNSTAVTSTAAEINALDGITAVVGELNALDLGSTAVGNAIASKAVILDSNKDYTGMRNFTATGDVEGGSVTVTDGVAISASSGDVTVANATSDKDLIFTVNDGGSATEVFRLDGDVSAMLVASGKELRFADSGEKISGDGTDLTIASGAKINLTATSDVVVPANVGITFGDGEKIEGDDTNLTVTSGGAINLTATTDVVVPANVGITFGTGEKIEGDNTDLTVTSGGKINLTATSDVVVPANVGITFGTGEKIEGDNTDLTVTSGAKITLAATSDVHIPNNVGIVFGGASEKIEGDGTDLVISANNLTVDAAADIILDAGGNDFQFKAGGTHILSVVNSSSDVVIKPIVDAKDIIFQQRDGTEVARIEDNATFNVVTGKLAINGTAITSTAAELNALDGITAVVGELNALDLGSTAVGNAIASKAVILDSNKDYTGLRNVTLSGELDAGSLDVSGNADIDGTLETDALTIGGTAIADVIAGTTVDLATLASTVTITDNESTNENNAMIFTAGGDTDGGNLGLESDGTCTYNPSTGKITATGFIGSLTGTASAAVYSDLAERYHADAVMEKGDVVEIGGTNEITKTTQEISPRVFGVISHEEQAAFKMNDGLPDDTHPLVALTGRADVKVIGPISKGDRLVTSSTSGVARKGTYEECTAFTVIGRALQDKTTEDVGIVLCYVNAKS